MKKTKKQQLTDECKHILQYPYSEGGIADYNEYNQFLCDWVPKLMDYMTTEGLERFRAELQKIYDNMLD